MSTLQGAKRRCIWVDRSKSANTLGMNSYTAQMKVVVNGKVAENKFPGSGATEKQEECGHRYEGADNACWTDDQPGNVPLPWEASHSCGRACDYRKLCPSRV